MTTRAYETWSPRSKAVELIHEADSICREYADQGYDLTLRQLYYQFVARGFIDNSQKEYKKLGSVINNARMAGYLNWDYIVDRTRNLESLPHWTGPQSVLRSAASSFGMDLWRDQPTRVEVWVEKEALAGVVERAADAWDCAYFSCRGYVSQSEQWRAGQRLGQYLRDGQNVVIVHLGDHDPSGIDMTRDIKDRIETFLIRDWYDFQMDTALSVTKGEVIADIESRMDGRNWFSVDRIALNWDQVQEYEPPPNPAKMTDTRAEKYVDEFGPESWELDALDPGVLDSLIQETVESYCNLDLLAASRAEQERHRGDLIEVASRWEEVVG